MCYAEKLVGLDYDGNEENLGSDFDGQFHCARFNCKGCNHRLVDGQMPKRNQGIRLNFCFLKII